MKGETLKLVSQANDFEEGLFGQIFLHIFEILPYLKNEGVNPIWEIRSRLYGFPERDFVVVPGILDPVESFSENRPSARIRKFVRYHELEGAVLGNDWAALSDLWHSYFEIPARIVARADQLVDLANALGLHYRGTDKNRALVETNFVSIEDFLMISKDFLQAHPEVKIIFIASDEKLIVDRMRTMYRNHRIVATGEVLHHKSPDLNSGFEKADHAVLDCLLLSRCKYLLKCQSALSGFSKVLNPSLEAYRISANKLTPWASSFPYFPDGFVPIYRANSHECQEVIDRLMAGDWTTNHSVAKKFEKTFFYRKRFNFPRIRFFGKWLFRIIEVSLGRIQSKFRRILSRV